MKIKIGKAQIPVHLEVQEARGCVGCIAYNPTLKGNLHNCEAVMKAARRAKLPNCDGYIYVLVGGN